MAGGLHHGRGDQLAIRAGQGTGGARREAYVGAYARTATERGKPGENRRAARKIFGVWGRDGYGSMAWRRAAWGNHYRASGPGQKAPSICLESDPAFPPPAFDP